MAENGICSFCRESHEGKAASGLNKNPVICPKCVLASAAIMLEQGSLEIDQLFDVAQAYVRGLLKNPPPPAASPSTDASAPGRTVH